MSTEVSLGDDALLHFESLRRKFIDHLTPRGNIPDDPKVQSNLLKAIDGGSKTVLTLKKIANDKETGKAMLGFQQQVADLLRNTVTTQQQVEQRRQAVIPDVVPRQGETAVGTKEVKYSEMVGKQETQG